MIVQSDYLSLDASFQGLSGADIEAFAAKRLPASFDKLRAQLLDGEFMNASEGREVTHCLNRSTHSVVRAGNGKNRFQEIVRELRSGRWKGGTGRVIKHVVNIGVGGSDLGPMMGSFALREFADDASLHNLQVHFVSSMDGGQLYAVLPLVDPEETLFIIASKSFGTIDTLANVATVRRWIGAAGAGKGSLTDEQWLARHVIGVSSNSLAMTEFGIPASQQLSFAPSVGGRFSLWSAIGLPIALTVGVHQFGRMLDGAAAMDEHFGAAPLLENIPLLLALFGVYNREVRGINNVAVLPYDGRLRYLPSYLQQLDMESNGKQVNHAGKAIDYPTGPIIWGGFGPNGQHAFFQHLHQGYDNFAADFVAVLRRSAPGFSAAVADGLASQQRLAMTNCLAHRRLMWFGSQSAEPRHCYPGGHPSNLLLMDELTPESFGALIAAYEHKVFTQGVIWELNSFDQPGVELGKKIAQGMLDGLDDVDALDVDESTRAVLKRL